MRCASRDVSRRKHRVTPLFPECRCLRGHAFVGLRQNVKRVKMGAHLYKKIKESSYVSAKRDVLLLKVKIMQKETVCEENKHNLKHQ